MIHVQRADVDCPAELCQPEETKTAIAFYDPAKNPANRAKPFPFTLYKTPSVRAALGRLFRRKCAYCESVYGATQPPEIEHWRPKNAVCEDDGSLTRPGYYWLAADWRNLLPSCVDCNRWRYQEVWPSGGTAKAGKGARFPVREQRRGEQMLPGAHLAETPLLLNPCEDQPERFLAFTNESDGGVLVSPGAGDADADRARASIDTYALNRMGLVLERRAVLCQLRNSLQLARMAVACLDAAATPQDSRRAEELVRQALQAVCDLLAPDRPYSLMVRQIAGPALLAMGVEGLSGSPS